MSAQSQVLEVTTEQMQRMMDQAKKRAKLGFIAEVEARANELQMTQPVAADVLRNYCEELRATVIPIKRPGLAPIAAVPAAVVSGGERDPLDTADEVVARQESSGAALPDVQHLDDDTEARAMVRNLGARGKLNFLRD